MDLNDSSMSHVPRPGEDTSVNAECTARGRVYTASESVRRLGVHSTHLQELHLCPGEHCGVGLQFAIGDQDTYFVCSVREFGPAARTSSLPLFLCCPREARACAPRPASRLLSFLTHLPFLTLFCGPCLRSTSLCGRSRRSCGRSAGSRRRRVRPVRA